MSEGNGDRISTMDPAMREILFLPPWMEGYGRATPRSRLSLFIAVALFLLTVVSTLAVGAQFAQDYAQGVAPFTDDFAPWRSFSALHVLLSGIPFSFTLMGILLAHELGHFFACRYYGIAASYPYFIPFPTIFGTMGAFIRIRSPILNRKALFDVGISGPVVGFVFALPALVLAILYSKVVPGANADAYYSFGMPLLMKGLTHVLRPGVDPGAVLLDPIGRAAWVGLLCTGLNLLPIGQLDGGHILFSLSSEHHRRISFLAVLLLLPMAFYFWGGWYVWAALALLFGFRHPVLLDRWEPIDGKRRIWALVALLIFVLCFMPAPIAKSAAALQ
ncbi:MAG TPA: site-2 protease family protein [Candidatus Acidoferrales bacterium]|nr:site-2 protease family protein [Candidatus Acidoferrales bacterium]